MLPPAVAAVVAASNFVILSMQRSGTTTMCEAINGFETAVCAYEILNFGTNNSGAMWQDHLHMLHAPRTPHGQLEFIRHAREATCEGR